MDLLELQTQVNQAVERVKEDERDPKDIKVSLQIDGPGTLSVFSGDNVEVHYDNDLQASGCVLTAYREIIR